AASSRERTNCASAGLKAEKTVTSSISSELVLRGNRSGLNWSREGLSQIRKNDDAGARLQEALDLHFDLLTNGGLGVVDDDHGSVREIANALSFVFALADDAQGNHFAGEQNQPHGLGQFVQVDMVD